MGLFTRIARTDPDGLAERLGGRGVFVLDVRQPSEWRHGHIRGSENVPLAQLTRRLDRFPRDRTIVTVCASGHRSAVAARALRRAGYEVENLKGGMHAWARRKLPIEKRRAR
ncbi:MAG TPA: rhodanese-like domain-containing protein [Gaiellaceae bacterium]|nr:rhodanese-like domain-containing protein [Gaiellaceae bacterium]